MAKRKGAGPKKDRPPKASPHKGETKQSIRTALNVGAGKKAGKKLRKKMAEKVVRPLISGIKKTGRKIRKAGEVGFGFGREVGLFKKGGSARTIAKKYFKGGLV
jgi:hypothetical protein